MAGNPHVARPLLVTSLLQTDCFMKVFLTILLQIICMNYKQK